MPEVKHLCRCECHRGVQMFECFPCCRRQGEVYSGDEIAELDQQQDDMELANKRIIEWLKSLPK